jgi:Fic family protein
VWLIDNNQASPIIKTGLFHHQFVFLHPFIDGNGRTLRLLTALVLLQVSYKINKYFVLDDYYDLDREAYSNALASADGGQQTNWLEYYTDGMKYSLQSALAKAKASSETLPVNSRPSRREAEVFELFSLGRQLTTKQVANHLNISRQQAFNLLHGLVNKGLLEKKGSTKDSYYKRLNMG